MPESSILEDAPKGTLPEPPPSRRRIVFTGRQRVGIPIMVLIVLLAITGQLGEHRTTAQASNARLALAVSYPDRIHYRQQMPMTLTVRNLAAEARDTIVVSLDTAYAQAFLVLSVMPSLARAYDVALTGMGPGESRIITLQVAGEDAGRARGSVIVRSGADTLRLPLSTFIFP